MSRGLRFSALLAIGCSARCGGRSAGTSITESVYARVRRDVVGDRILDLIDPAYTKGARRARKKAARRVETIASIPEPKGFMTYEVGSVSRTLNQWARKSGIAQSTLHWRVVKQGWTMAEALAAGPGRISRQSPIADRSTAGILPGNPGTGRPLLAPLTKTPSPDSQGNEVGQDRLELSANGLRDQPFVPFSRGFCPGAGKLPRNPWPRRPKLRVVIPRSIQQQRAERLARSIEGEPEPDPS